MTTVKRTARRAAPATPRQAPAGAPVPDTFREDFAALKQAVHDMRGHQQQRVAADTLAARITPQQPSVPADPVPGWIKLMGAVLGILVAGSVIAGGLWTMAIAPMATRVTSLEAWRAELVLLPARMGTIESSVATATRIRDQQQQGMTERLAALERQDQAQSQQTQQIISSLATVTAQLTEVVRRLDRWEQNLNRRSSGEAPAMFRRDSDT